jgi:hypothetical protein
LPAAGWWVKPARKQKNYCKNVVDLLPERRYTSLRLVGHLPLDIQEWCTPSANGVFLFIPGDVLNGKPFVAIGTLLPLNALFIKHISHLQSQG